MSGGGMEQRRMPKSFWKSFSPVVKTEEEQTGAADESKNEATESNDDNGSESAGGVFYGNLRKETICTE